MVGPSIFHLSSVPSGLMDPVLVAENPCFAQQTLTCPEMEALVYDYLVSEGFADAAHCFRDELRAEKTDRVAPISDSDSDDGLRERMEIRGSIERGDIAAAVEQVNQTAPELLDDSPCLNFALLQQRLLELIRAGKPEDALKFAQEYMVGCADATGTLPELEQTLALLATPPSTSTSPPSPFSSLLSTEHRLAVARRINSALLQNFGEAPCSRLENLLKLVLWMQEQVADEDETTLDDLLFLDDDRTAASSGDENGTAT